MKTLPISKKEKYFRRSITGLGCLVCVLGVCYGSYKGETYGIILSAISVCFVLIPLLVEKMLRCRFSPIMYSLCTLYAIGPMLGKVFSLYYLTAWWDKLLHGLAGILFAVFGVFLSRKLNRKECSVALCAFFAICFSMAISVAWEFVEYTSDNVFHTDMQRDTYVHSLTSYDLGEEPGQKVTIESIDSVQINDREIAGYLDIGLHDTMRDMLTETAGALLFAVLFVIDRGKHTWIRQKE